jgi:hypothetical protein
MEFATLTGLADIDKVSSNLGEFIQDGFAAFFSRVKIFFTYFFRADPRQCENPSLSRSFQGFMAEWGGSLFVFQHSMYYAFVNRSCGLKAMLLLWWLVVFKPLQELNLWEAVSIDGGTISWEKDADSMTLELL